MRHDLRYVLGESKTPRKSKNKGHVKTCRQDKNFDEAPQRLSMRSGLERREPAASRTWSVGKRWLAAQVGQQWDDVYAALSKLPRYMRQYVAGFVQQHEPVEDRWWRHNFAVVDGVLVRQADRIDRANISRKARNASERTEMEKRNKKHTSPKGRECFLRRIHGEVYWVERSVCGPKQQMSAKDAARLANEIPEEDFGDRYEEEKKRNFYEVSRRRSQTCSLIPRGGASVALDTIKSLFAR